MRSPHVRLAALLLVCTLATALPAAAAPLDDARDAFREADFELALSTLATVQSARGVSDADRAAAFVLAAQCHARLDHEDEAVDSLCRALALQPRWTPDPTSFSPHEMRLWRRALAQCPPKIDEREPPPLAPSSAESVAPAGQAWYERKLVWVGAGAAALAAVLLMNGDDSGGGPGEIVVPTFPDPPGASASAAR